MCGRRPTAICSLFAITFLTCACATSSRRSVEESLSRDLKSDGFQIVYKSDEDSPETTASVTDAESADRLIQWFHHCPKESSDELAKVHFLRDLGFQTDVPTLMITTDRCRVRFVNLLSQIVLETRDSTAGEWKQVSWEMRQEDADLRDWAMSQVVDHYKRRILDQAVLDADSEMPDLERVGPLLHSDEE